MWEERARRGATAALLLLAAILPLELTRPLFRAGPVAVTNVEVVLLVTLGLGGLALLLSGRFWPDTFPRSWRWLWPLIVGGLLLAAALAPAERLNALKAALRTAEGMALAVVVVHVTRQPPVARWVGAALLAGALVATLIGLAETLAGSPFPFLAPFRQAPTAVGPFWRLSATFDHANQVAMYLEATLPLLLVFTMEAWRRSRFLGLLFCAWILLHIEAALLTYSRTAFATLIMAFGATGLLLILRRAGGMRSARPWLGTTALVLLLLMVNAALNPIFRLRLTSEGDNEWYRVGYEVPRQLEMATGGRQDVSLALVNDGRLHWRHDGERPIIVTARWESPSLETPFNARWPLPHSVAPGERVDLTIPLDAPNVAGEYTLVWDLIQERVVWFSQKNGQNGRTDVTVSGPPRSDRPAGAFGGSQQARPDERQVQTVAPPIPDRRTLWGLAAQRWRERPWFGIGLDNFRLTYGTYLGYTIWNNAIHTNNWYIETVVSLGVLGGLPFFAWMAFLLYRIWRRISMPASPPWALAVATGVLAFYIHGILDYFMLFNPTALLFWILVGLLVAPASDGQVAGSPA